MSRSIKTYSLDSALVAAIAERSRALGVSQSALVEEGLRLALDLPATPRESGTGERVPASERAVLEVLERRGAGAHTGVELAEASGYSFAITERACKALALRGAAHRWGDAPRFSDGRPGGGWWGLRTGPAEVRRVIDAWRARGAPPDQEPALIDLARKLCECMGPAAAAEARAALAEALRVEPGALG